MAAAVKSEDQFLCSICLDLFTEPVTTPCGHNFCKLCLSQHWDTKLLSQAGESCLVCLSSYCETHLQPHLSMSRLKSHQLIQPVDNMEERMCPQHHRPLELFCCNDHTCVCIMCSVLEHQCHKFVYLKEEFHRRKAALQQTQEQSLDMVEQRRLKIQKLQSSVEQSQTAAHTEMATGLEAFNALIECVQRSREAFIQKLQERQRHTQKQAEALILQLQQEICALQQRSTEAETLQHSEDHLHFLLHCTTLTPPTGLKDWSKVTLETETYEGTAGRALVELEDNTAQVNLSVSDDLKQVHLTYLRNFTDSPLRFTWWTVLTKQNFSSGTFYFKVQVKDKTSWYLGVAKQSVNRKNTNALTSNYGYWCLYMKNIGEFEACSDPAVLLSLKCPPQNVGVFVDYDEGLVSFYDADSADLIYSFTDCSFSEKLFPFLNCFIFRSRKCTTTSRD
uniref:Uncharacterized protein n=1 Tax=Periophthalmus magnuspinnatus TaxID=409849 RepID=A0A3B4BBC7_9GOBI